jgi:hypothetical protein
VEGRDHIKAHLVIDEKTRYRSTSLSSAVYINVIGGLNLKEDRVIL